MLIPSPESAYEVCKEFMPECSKPLSSPSGAASSTSAIKRQLPLSVTGPRGASNDFNGSSNLVYAQAPPGSYIVRLVRPFGHGSLYPRLVFIRKMKDPAMESDSASQERTVAAFTFPDRQDHAATQDPLDRPVHADRKENPDGTAWAGARAFRVRPVTFS